MAFKVKFPIRAKLLILLTVVVLLSIITYLALAVKLFRDDKVSLVYELNASNVRTLAAEVEAQLKKSIDKVKLLTQGHRDPDWVRAVFEAEPDLISFSLFRPTRKAGSWYRISRLTNENYLALYDLKRSAVRKIRKEFPIPFDRVLAEGTYVQNSTLSNGAPILTVALGISVRNQSKRYVAVVDLRLDRILKLLRNRGIARVFIVDRTGKVIGHSNALLIKNHADLSKIPIVQMALNSKTGLETKQFNWQGENWLGAFSKIDVGHLQVISQVEEREVFRAAQRLIGKSILFALLIITIALFLSGRLAQSLTEPLHKLMTATEKISKWNFEDSVKVKTNDEIGHLAEAFNTMSRDLQTQRNQIEKHQLELEEKVRERTADLEAQKKKAAEAQDALLRTTKLSSLGELAGAAAHEVLNPINNMNIRLQKMRNTSEEDEVEDARVLKDIVSGWMNAYKSGGWENLQKELGKEVEATTGKRTLLEEDLENLGVLATDSLKRFKNKKEDFRFLDNEITRVSKIINNMRSLARVGGEKRQIDIHIPLDDTIATLSDVAEKKGVQIIKSFPSNTTGHEVLADKDELVQVFSNLIRNGIQAVLADSKSEKKVTISTSCDDDRVEVRIQDSGVGIPKKNQSKVFETSFTTKSIVDGTGLGLSISRRLVRAFGGDIELEDSTPGKGSTFLVWFPTT